ncbi:hypothetical protein RM530_03920 [Algiphilus sp. W345]|uniref:Lipoprotein n=1 Tax=Banduia mediterranea TaxID=3075609 RepID=A0ABU2WHF9_9GAMM|nr:hypothetical protein [Algiphilus sp. W345]MDT0496512.1 hypothetical protein [Algiphilus sp. W345]
MLGRAIAGLAGLRAYAIGLLVWVLCAVALVAGGYRWGWTAKANAVAAAQLQSVQNAAAADREARAAQARIDRTQSTALAADRAEARIVYRTIREEVPHVVTQIVRVPATPEAPACECPDRNEYSRGFVRVWNRALDPGVPGTAGGPTDAAGGADPADAAAAAVSTGDVLANHVDNAELWYDQRAQCQRLIEWQRQTCQRLGKGKDCAS